MTRGANDFGGHAQSSFVTPTSWLARELEPAIKRLDAETGLTKNMENVGGVDRMAQAAARTYLTARGERATATSLIRRIHIIRKHSSITTRIELADALLLAAGIHLEETDLPTLPAGRAAAVEMVNVYNEVRETPMPELETHALAASLLAFATGFVLDPTEQAWREAPAVLRAA